jgi:hypothetical protein
MIENVAVAKQITELMTDIFNRLCGTCEIVREQCSPEEHKAYLKATSRIACGIVFDVMEPLYERHPELKPANWDEADNGPLSPMCPLSRPDKLP